MALLNWLGLGKKVLTVAEDLGPVAASAFGGPAAGGLVQAVIAEVHGAVAAGGGAPNVNLLKTSIGQIIEGVIGVLQATGRVPGGLTSGPLVQSALRTMENSPFPKKD